MLALHMMVGYDLECKVEMILHQRARWLGAREHQNGECFVKKKGLQYYSW